MWMSLIGDLIGSSYENKEEKSRKLPFLNQESTITDETILLVGTADSILNGIPFEESYLKWSKKYPNVAFGPGFKSWINNPSFHFGSFGNGAASRASIIGLAFEDENKVLENAEKSAICSHNHPEGITGAKASALAVFYAKKNTSFEKISQIMIDKFDYLLFYDMDELHENLGNDSTAINTVPIAIYIGFKSKSIDDCIKNCLYVGGDVDTIMSIACAIASERFPEEKLKEPLEKLVSIIEKDKEMISIISDFNKKYSKNKENASQKNRY